MTADLRRFLLMGLFLVTLAHLLHDLPARTAATVQQAEQMGDW